MIDEMDAVRARYSRRDGMERYTLLQPDVQHALQERQRAMRRLFVRLGWRDLSIRHAVEVGCGAGGNLLDLLRFGFAAERLTGIELLPERLAHARRVLPASVKLLEGDATRALLESASQDVVLQSTVFSSVLDDAAQQRLADAMWRWLKPGGGVLWYDFAVDNPRNLDVRGVPIARVRTLFPAARVTASRVTLAPPLARALGLVHPGLIGAFNLLPLLRTHRLAWIEKAA